MVKSRLGAATGWRRPPIFAALRLRPVSAQHTDAEGACIQRWATDRRQLVEIGVAEGASAAETRAVMHPDGELVLIDPYVDSRIPGLQFMRAVAHRIVASVDRGSVVWIDDYSANAAKTWDRPIDFLFIDGDHSVEGVRDDWRNGRGGSARAASSFCTTRAQRPPGCLTIPARSSSSRRQQRPSVGGR